MICSSSSAQPSLLQWPVWTCGGSSKILRACSAAMSSTCIGHVGPVAHEADAQEDEGHGSWSQPVLESIAALLAAVLLTRVLNLCALHIAAMSAQ